MRMLMLRRRQTMVRNGQHSQHQESDHQHRAHQNRMHHRMQQPFQHRHHRRHPTLMTSQLTSQQHRSNLFTHSTFIQHPLSLSLCTTIRYRLTHIPSVHPSRSLYFPPVAIRPCVRASRIHLISLLCAHARSLLHSNRCAWLAHGYAI